MEQYAVRLLKEKKNIQVLVPGSKSITNRALMLAAMSDTVCELRGVLFSEDSRAFLDCLKTLGFRVEIDEKEHRVVVFGENGKIPNSNVEINVRSAGTAARFLTVFLAAAGGTYVLNASEQMKKRPMKELLDKIRAQGVAVEFLEEPDHFPFRIHSLGMRQLETEIDTTTSSQYASGLLMAAPIHGMKITLTGSRTEGSYIQMTLRMMEQFGISWKRENNTYEIAAQNFGIPQYFVEPDFSAACYFYAMAMILKTKALVFGTHKNSMQGDRKFLDVLEQMGAKIADTEQGVTVDAGNLKAFEGITVDMSDFSDQALTMAVVAAFATSKTVIQNIGHIRKQESDRVQAMVNGLERLGCRTRIVEKENRTDVEIIPEPLHGAVIETYDDHRVAMSFAMAGLAVEGVVIRNPLCCRKTFEEYFNVLDRLTEK